MIELSVESKLIGVNEEKIYTHDTGGKGRSIILIHGWPLSGRAWKKQMKALTKAEYRVITYDRRGFGESDKPKAGYDYDTLADDLAGLIKELDLHDVVLVGFSMGGGEVARYISKYGEEKLNSVVFASAVPPMMMKTSNNPDGPLEPAKAEEMNIALTENPDEFYDQFTKEFFSANADGIILVTEDERQDALTLCKQADKMAALEAMKSFATTDFRKDLMNVTVPTLVIHGDVDGIVPFEGSGKRTHESIPHSKLHVVAGGPHGINVSHTDEFNKILIDFIKKN